jgi:tetratricopeptide (TPR) repeat protein
MKGTTYQGYMAMVAGESRIAEGHFLAADVEHLYVKHGKHLYALGGVWWGEFLVRTGRPGPARRLTDRNREVVADLGWNEDVARCDRLLARLDLAAEDPTTAEHRLIAAAATFRDGDVLLELAETLPVLAECARASGDLEAAARHAEEALNIIGPRGLLLSHAAALTVRARICADQVAAGSREHVESGRDAADAAHRIATRRQLAWQLVDALDAHARLDQVESIDRGWAQQAAAQRARLTPVELDPDPLATVERQVARRTPSGHG